MKEQFFDFDYTVPQKFMFKPSNGSQINLSISVRCFGCVIDENPTVKITGFSFIDTGFAFVEDNYRMWEDLYCKAMDEYKRLHCNATPIDLNVVELAEYGITNFHPSLNHLN